MVGSEFTAFAVASRLRIRIEPSATSIVYALSFGFRCWSGGGNASAVSTNRHSRKCHQAPFPKSSGRVSNWVAAAPIFRCTWPLKWQLNFVSERPTHRLMA
jgi:hypothetical protein